MPELPPEYVPAALVAPDAPPYPGAVLVSRHYRRRTGAAHRRVPVLSVVAATFAGLLIAVGSFMPWATVGIFSRAGTEGDGVITLVLGVALLITAGVLAGLRPGLGAATALRVLALAACLGAFAIVLYDGRDVLAKNQASAFTISIGSGIYLIGIAAAIGILALLASLSVDAS